MQAAAAELLDHPELHTEPEVLAAVARLITGARALAEPQTLVVVAVLVVADLTEATAAAASW